MSQYNTIEAYLEAKKSIFVSFYNFYFLPINVTMAIVRIVVLHNFGVINGTLSSKFLCVHKKNDIYRKRYISIYNLNTVFNKHYTS